MKKLNVFILLLLWPLFSWSIKEQDSTGLSYHVFSDKESPELTKSETRFEITFYNYGHPINEMANKEIQYSANGKSKKVKTDQQSKFNLTVKPGKYRFLFFYNNEYFEVYTDSIKASPAHKVEMAVYFISSVNPVIADKPVIYVYPEKTTEINIQLDFKGEMLFTYPAYNTGWNFTAENDGTIKMNGKEYNYLFWEGTSNLLQKEIRTDEGFIVEKNNLLSFLENSLTQMGLNTKEQADFITYWFPRMMHNEKNYVRFIFNEDYNQYAEITVNPRPQTMLRVFMVWMKFEGEANSGMKEQQLPAFLRNGFTLVEWGGSEIIQPEN